MASIPSSPPAPTGPIKARLKQALPVRFHVCPWPDFYSTLDACWRDWYRWAETIVDAPAHIKSWLNQLAWQTYARQTERWLACRQSHFAPTPQPQTGLRLVVSSHLAGAQAGGRPPQEGMQTRLSVRFAPVNAPAPCPAIPYQLVHQVSEVGIDYFPHLTSIDFTDEGYEKNFNGIGPWEGCKVLDVLFPEQAAAQSVLRFFHTRGRLTTPKVFEHWVRFRPIGNPPPDIMARSAPFNATLLNLQTWFYYSGWEILSQYSHVESGAWQQQTFWLLNQIGLAPVGMAGMSANITFIEPAPSMPTLGDIEGTWRHRLVVSRFQRPPTDVKVTYDGMMVGSVKTSIIMSGTASVPGNLDVTGIIKVEEQVTIRTVGATKASFRILGVEPVPGFGMRFTIKVVNELHFDACIVTQFLSGLRTDIDMYDNGILFVTPTIWVARNLAAHSESDPISILVPARIKAPGDFRFLCRDLIHFSYTGYAAPLNQFADGIYGPQLYGTLPEDIGWLRGALMVSDVPSVPAILRAAYLENGDKVWDRLRFYDPDRLLVTMPVRKAPGADYQEYFDAHHGTSLTQVSFVGIYDWTVESVNSGNPEVVVPVSGRATLVLDFPSAIALYGRVLTLPVAAGRPMWASTNGKWYAVFESWPGGDVNQLSNHLVDTQLRPRYSGAQYRNFQFTTVKPPHLVAGIGWLSVYSPPNDGPGSGVYVLTLIRESASADYVDVMLMNTNGGFV